MTMSEPQIDTSATREIAASPLRLMLMVLGALAFVVAGYFMTLATEDTQRYSATLIQFLGYIAIAFFGLCALIGGWRLLTQRGPVIALSPEGFRDVRVSRDVVRWPAIASIGTWTHSGQRIMVLELKPGEEEKLRLTAIAWMSRGANARLGADGLAVTALGTKIGHDRLMTTTQAYMQAHGGGRPAAAEIR
jgi:hypothetical protein